MQHYLKWYDNCTSEIVADNVVKSCLLKGFYKVTFLTFWILNLTPETCFYHQDCWRSMQKKESRKEQHWKTLSCKKLIKESTKKNSYKKCILLQSPEDNSEYTKIKISSHKLSLIYSIGGKELTLEKNNLSKVFFSSPWYIPCRNI